MLEPGQPAPEFELPDADMQTVDLSAFKGKKNVVLYFYPKDGTPGCTLVTTDFSDHEEQFVKHDCVVLGVSRDDCLTHADFRDRNGVTIGLLSDPGPPGLAEYRPSDRVRAELEVLGLLVEGKRIRNRQERGMILSAARSWLFNQVLAERVRQGNWQSLLPGDPMPVASGPLWGRGRPLSSDQTGALEQQALAPWGEWCSGLEHVGLSQERRALQLPVTDPQWRWLDQDLELTFTLSSGEFATAVLRELVQLESVEHAPAISG
jgi:peroxiredoxin